MVVKIPNGGHGFTRKGAEKYGFWVTLFPGSFSKFLGPGAWGTPLEMGLEKMWVVPR